MAVEAPELLISLGLVQLLVWAFCCLQVYQGWRLPIYHPTSVFLAYYFVGWVLRPFAIVTAGGSPVWDFVGTDPTGFDAVYGATMGIMALLSFCYGPILVWPDIYKQRDIPERRLEIGAPAGFAICAIILVVLGAIGTSQVVAFSTTVVHSFKTVYLETGGQALVGTSGYLTMSSRYLLLMACILIAIYRKLSIIILVTVAFVAFRFYVGAGRAEFVALVAVLLLVMMVRAKMTVLPWQTIVPILGLFWVFDFLGGNRLAFRRLIAGDTSFGDLVSSYLDNRGDGFGTSDFQEFDTGVSTIRAVHDLDGFNWGVQYLRLFIWPIPRQIWPDKPVETDLIPFQSVGNFQVITRSMVGDLYSNFGPLAVIIGAILVAVSCVWIYRRMAESPSAVFYISALTFYSSLPIYFRNSFVPVLYEVLVCLPATILIVWLGKIRFAPADQPVKPIAEPAGALLRPVTG
ncbi:MAG: O-antigen polymerase [Devosia sp.]